MVAERPEWNPASESFFLSHSLVLILNSRVLFFFACVLQVSRRAPRQRQLSTDWPAAL